jgi:hypothetical protein
LLTVYGYRKDAIIVSFGLSQRSFKPQIEEVKDEIRILVHNPTAVGQKKLLGYILFNGKNGSVELSNFKAQMSRSNLELGGTTKRNNHDVAGTHGEGLKVAALFLRRNDHRVRITSQNYNWTFVFRGEYKSNLYCRLAPVPDSQIRRALKIDEKFKANPATDVCMIIEKPRGAQGKKISEEDFRNWIKVTLDLERPKDPSDIVETDDGDLILDKRFAGKMYLKGLLLPSGGSSIKKLEVGYNLLKGATNRDRERLKNEEEEAKTLMHIWERAIRKCGESILQRYVGLLLDNPSCVDVTSTERLISEDTALAIWEYLKRHGIGMFYHNVEGDNTDIMIIKTHLKRQPASLTPKLWKILRKFCLVRTPQEQRIYLFRNSSPSEEPATMFSTSIQRGLKASLSLHNRTQHISVEYVSGAETDIDLLFEKEQQLLKVHEKWLNFTRIHVTAQCRISSVSNIQPPNSVFLCDHVIEEIYELAVHEIIESLTLQQGDAITFARSMRVKVRENSNRCPVLSQ